MNLRNRHPRQTSRQHALQVKASRSRRPTKPFLLRDKTLRFVSFTFPSYDELSGEFEVKAVIRDDEEETLDLLPACEMAVHELRALVRKM